MAIKKKVTYSVNYVAGTDTLSTQLNRLLNDVVDLILDHHPELQVLDTITYGSERMTGAPLYSGGGVTGLLSGTYDNHFYESDLVFLGTNEDNVCLSLGFYDGVFVVAMNMTPKVEAAVTDVWTSKYNLSTSVPFYAIGKASRRFSIAYSSTTENKYNYSIPYRIVNDSITLSILYWHTEYSSGYNFINGADESDGVKLIIFKTDEGNNVTGIGAAINQWGVVDSGRAVGKNTLLVWSFNENLLNNLPDTISAVTSTSSSNADTAANDISVLINSKVEIRQWYNCNNNNVSHTGINNFGSWHTLGLLRCGQLQSTTDCMPWVYTVNTIYTSATTQYPSGATDSNFKTFMASPYNVPYLQPGQAYIRKMRIPGWNPYCKGEIYLFWTPSLSAYQSGDIIEIGNKQYAIITDGVVCWVARVA